MVCMKTLFPEGEAQVKHTWRYKHSNEWEKELSTKEACFRKFRQFR